MEKWKVSGKDKWGYNLQAVKLLDHAKRQNRFLYEEIQGNILEARKIISNCH